jgi:hypothetical protein
MINRLHELSKKIDGPFNEFVLNLYLRSQNSSGVKRDEKDQDSLDKAI